MKTSLKIQIPEPCHEDWQSMTASENGRSCASCNKEVIDFSSMTDREVLQHFAASIRPICGRAETSQLNRALIMPAQPLNHWKYWLSAASSFIIMMGRTDAQVTIKTAQQYSAAPKLMRMGAVATLPETKIVKRCLKGRVVDTDGNAIAFASVVMKSNLTGAAADSSGNFVLSISGDNFKVTLQITAVGFDPLTVDLIPALVPGVLPGENEFLLVEKNIVMERQIMQEIVLVGNQRSRMAGGMTMGIAISHNKMAKAIREMVGLANLKVYPNPVLTGTQFTVCINVKDMGAYVLQFIDAAGRIVTGKKINIVSSKQTETFYSSIFSASGIYFIHLVDQKSGNRYSSQLYFQ